MVLCNNLHLLLPQFCRCPAIPSLISELLYITTPIYLAALLAHQMSRGFCLMVNELYCCKLWPKCSLPACMSLHSCDAPSEELSVTENYVQWNWFTAVLFQRSAESLSLGRSVHRCVFPQWKSTPQDFLTVNCCAGYNETSNLNLKLKKVKSET